ncbi:MAG: hypothetical protein IPI20_20860 [Rhodoferax sp.]|nr:hypothetical protein [Rhodoferax sp.]
MTSTSPDETIDPIEVSHADFCRGLPAGHYRLIVNPVKARKYVRQRLFIVAISMPMSAIGVLLALSGSTWWGLGLVLASFVLHRGVSAHAAKFCTWRSGMHAPIATPLTRKFWKSGTPAESRAGQRRPHATIAG